MRIDEEERKERIRLEEMKIKAEEAERMERIKQEEAERTY